MTTINGQLWNRCVNPECETLVPAGTRNYDGLCRECAPPSPSPVQDPETMEITADDVGQLEGLNNGTTED